MSRLSSAFQWRPKPTWRFSPSRLVPHTKRNEWQHFWCQRHACCVVQAERSSHWRHPKRAYKTPKNCYNQCFGHRRMSRTIWNCITNGVLKTDFLLEAGNQFFPFAIFELIIHVKSILLFFVYGLTTSNSHFNSSSGSAPILQLFRGSNAMRQKSITVIDGIVACLAPQKTKTVGH